MSVSSAVRRPESADATAPASTGVPVRASLRRVVRNFGFLAGASLGGQAIGFLVLTIVSRRVGAENLGSWYFAMSVASYMALPVTLGLQTLATREIAQTPTVIRRAVGEVIVWQGGAAVVMYGVLLLLTPTIAHGEASVAALLPIAGLTFVLGAVTSEWQLQAIQRGRPLAMLRFAGQVVYGCLCLALVTDGLEGVTRYAWLNMLGLAITVVGTGVVFVRAVGVPDFGVRPAELLRRIVRSAPFAASLIMVQAYWATGPILLRFLGSTADVGQYGVALKLPQVIVALALIWVTTVYPHSAMLAKEDPGRLREQIGMLSTVAVIGCLPLGVIASFTGPDVMRLLFGAEYGPAGGPFAVLILLGGLMAASVNFTNTMLAVGDERRYVAYVTAGAAVGVAVNVALIPSLGAMAPALGILLAEATVLVLAARRLRHTLGPIRLDRGRIGRALPAAAASAVVLVAVPDGLWVPLQVGAAGLGFACVGWITGAWKAEDWRSVRAGRGGHGL